MRPVPEAALDLVKRWEGCELKAYPDPATGGEPWTIGYGHAVGVRPGQIISGGQATTFLRADLGIAAQRLWDQIGTVVEDLTDNQYTALLSFVLNVGADAKWTIWKRLKARQFDQVPGELIKFVNANGKKMQGLVNRRTDEIRVWSTDEPGSEDANPASHITRLVDTPPTPADPTPARKSKPLWAVVVSAVTAGLAAVKDFVVHGVSWLINLVTPDQVNSVMGAAQPYAEKSHVVAGAISGLAVVAAALAAFLAFQKHNEQRR